MRTPRKNIEDKALDLLRQSGAVRAPVPIDRVARYLNLQIQPVDLGEEVSGVLVVSAGGGVIGYNLAQHPVRQRFTVAHEIGHFVLHHTVKELFIDKQYTAIYKRDQASSQGDHRLEIEANRFAAALLIPKDLLIEEIMKLHFDLASESAMKALAEKFSVSTQAMSIRLGQLGILPD